MSLSDVSQTIDFGSVLSRHELVAGYAQRARYLWIGLGVAALPCWGLAIRSLIRGTPIEFFLVMAGFGACFAGLGEVVRRQVAAVEGLRAVLHENGMIAERAREPFAIAWGDVAELRVKQWDAPAREWSGLDARMLLDDGNVVRLKLENFQVKGLFRMGRVLTTSVAMSQLPQARERYANGEWLHFGEVEVSRTGIRTKSKTATWDELAVVEATRGLLVLRRKVGGWAWKVVPLRKIPNALTLLEVIRPELTSALDFGDLVQLLELGRQY